MPYPKGKPRSAETRAKLSAAGKGVPKSAETKARMSAAAKVSYADGKRDEFKQHMRETNPMHDPEVAARVGQALQGHEVSQELRERFSAMFKGKKRGPHSDETRERMSAAQLKVWQSGRKDAFRIEAAARLSGAGNHQWLGGKSKELYAKAFDETLRRIIRQRDKNECAVCGARASSVHHIDYGKNNCDPANLITLCLKCHGLTHTNRLHWQVALGAIAIAREAL